MEHTANYQLSQWEATDRIQMEDFNGDNAKVEAALTALAAADNNAAHALTTAVSRLNGRFYTGTYVGTNTFPRSLLFPRKPLLVAAGNSDDGDFMLLFPAGGGVGLAIYPGTANVTGIVSTAQGNGISWNTYCNRAGKTYTVLALLEA